jgi:hypothetical protein
VSDSLHKSLVSSVKCCLGTCSKLDDDLTGWSDTIAQGLLLLLLPAAGGSSKRSGASCGCGRVELLTTNLLMLAGLWSEEVCSVR